MLEALRLRCKNHWLIAAVLTLITFSPITGFTEGFEFEGLGEEDKGSARLFDDVLLVEL